MAQAEGNQSACFHQKHKNLSYTEVKLCLSLQENCVFPTRLLQALCSLLLLVQLGWQMRQLGVLQTLALTLCKKWHSNILVLKSAQTMTKGSVSINRTPFGLVIREKTKTLLLQMFLQLSGKTLLHSLNILAKTNTQSLTGEQHIQRHFLI